MSEKMEPYLSLDEYGSREGFVFVGEVASGWVKNIRNHIRVGQRVVAKVIGVKKDRERVDLSIKSVSEERRRDTLQSGKTNSVLTKSWVLWLREQDGMKRKLLKSRMR